MMRARFVLLLALWSVVACGEVALDVGGERAARRCPPDEVCSPRTPGGLRFSDAAPTAVEGRHTISVEVGPSDVEVVSSDPTVLRIVQTWGSTVRFEGVSPGTAFLRYLEADGRYEGMLLDRLELDVKAVDRVVARPTEAPLPIGALPTHYLGPMKIHVDHAEVTLAPYAVSEDQSVLVDEGMAIVRPSSEDNPVPLNAGEPIVWEVTRAGLTYSDAIPVVDTADELRVTDLSSTVFNGTGAEPILDAAVGPCVVPFHEGVPVYGATLSVHVTSRSGSFAFASEVACPISEMGRSQWDVRIGSLQRRFRADGAGADATITPL